VLVGSCHGFPRTSPEMEDTASLRDYLLRVGINISCDTGGSGGGSTFSAGVYTLCGGGTGALWMDAGTRGTQPELARVAVGDAASSVDFVGDYGLLFWAERRVPSGVAAGMMATIPLFMALAEILLLGTQRLTARLTLALLAGLGGVIVLVGPTMKLSGAPLDRVGAMALIAGAMSWSVASAMARKLPLPTSKAMSSGAQMLAGGVLLGLVSGALGEWRGFHPMDVSKGAWFALLYLVVAGSIIGFTAYVWLLHHESPTKVGTYAYVNPVVAVLVGYFLGGEALGLRTLLGTAFVLASVVVITTTRANKPAKEEAG
jgi:drug/metabolite transporter (DMT)-like permease